MHTSTDTTYRHVQGLSRGLRILRALNEADSVGATPRDLSNQTNINRTTVKRILETLAEEGYVRASECEGRYGIAPDVLQLSRGMTADNRVLADCLQAMNQLGHATGWSLRITTPSNGRMVIRDSTHPSSNIAFEAWGGLRHTLPILSTAAGRAYFAHSHETARAQMVEAIRSHRDEQAAVASNAKLVEQITRRVLADGYSINDGLWGQRHLGAVAVPIRRADAACAPACPEPTITTSALLICISSWVMTSTAAVSAPSVFGRDGHAQALERFAVDQLAGQSRAGLPVRGAVEQGVFVRTDRGRRETNAGSTIT